jgi:hypothetical protein
MANQITDHVDDKTTGANADANAINSDENSNAVKDPHDWATGEEPMTGAQKSYLKTLSDQAGEEFDDTLTKADASLKIDELQQKTGRGTS